jgi:hypothetical protein
LLGLLGNIPYGIRSDAAGVNTIPIDDDLADNREIVHWFGDAKVGNVHESAS